MEGSDSLNSVSLSFTLPSLFRPIPFYSSIHYLSFFIRAREVTKQPLFFFRSWYRLVLLSIEAATTYQVD